MNPSQISPLDGTYHAVVSKYHPDGEVTIKYADKATERVNLNAVEWKHTRKGQKALSPSL